MLAVLYLYIVITDIIGLTISWITSYENGEDIDIMCAKIVICGVFGFIIFPYLVYSGMRKLIKEYYDNKCKQKN